MQPVTFAANALQRLVLARFRIILTCVAVFGVGALLCQRYQSGRGPTPRSPLSQRAFAMCRAIAGSCESVTAPRLYDESVPLAGLGAVQRRVWSVSCQSEGRHLNLLFNEKTGRICCAFGESRALPDSPHSSAGIATPEEALHIARLRLKQLEMISPDARYTLTEKPRLTRENTAWEINWQVQRRGDATPRRLKMAFDREDGFPLHISDLYELQQFAAPAKQG